MKRLFFSLALAFSSSGCALIFSGTTDTVRITSDPTDAKVYVSGEGGTSVGHSFGRTSVAKHSGGVAFTTRTPATLELSKGATWVIRIEKQGYEPEIFTVAKSINPLVWLNIFNLLLLVPIDWATDAMWYFPNPDYHVVLRREENLQAERK